MWKVYLGRVIQSSSIRILIVIKKGKKGKQKGEANKEHEWGNLKSELSRIDENTTEKSHSPGMHVNKT